MAGRGPRPKPNARRTNNRDLEVEVPANPAVQAPRLFRRSRYSTATQRWWDNWVNSPQAESFLASDWERLQMLAPLVEAYWDEPRANILAEIRLNEERLGATLRDRQSLRMSIKPDSDETPDENSDDESVVDLELYRELGGA